MISYKKDSNPRHLSCKSKTRINDPSGPCSAIKSDVLRPNEQFCAFSGFLKGYRYIEIAYFK